MPDSSSRPKTTRRGWVVVVSLALAVLVPAAAGAAPPAPPPSDAVSAAELADRAAHEAAQLSGDRAEQTAARHQAAATLAAYQEAERRAGQARRTAEAAADRSRVAQARTAAARARLAEYAGSLYRKGAGSARANFYSSVLQVREPQTFFHGLGLAQRAGGSQANALGELAEAEAAQQREAERLTAASTAADEATAAAAEAKAAADRVVADIARRVAARLAQLAATQDALAAAQQRELRLAQAEQIARDRSAAPDAAIEGAFVPRPAATCAGGPTAGLPNGRLPTAALCPLWGTRGQMLRADAAAAFDEMSRAYAAEFGAPICVTDSYRNYDEQVAVALAKPDLAARPGTSNHGWGVALDLCDGIQTFGSPQHEWMVESSMAFGWFHPAWAQAGGSKPEAWHWEFAG